MQSSRQQPSQPLGPYSVCSLEIVSFCIGWLCCYRASRRLPRFLLHERFVPNDVTIQTGSTQPPTLLTEADLIDKMDKVRIPRSWVTCIRTVGSSYGRCGKMLWRVWRVSVKKMFRSMELVQTRRCMSTYVLFRYRAHLVLAVALIRRETTRTPF